MNKIGLNKNSATSVEHKLKLIENELLKEQNSILRLSSSLYSIKVSNKSEIDRTRQVLKSMLNSIQRDLHMIRTFKARYHKFIRDIINYDKKMAMQINKDYNTYYNTKKLGHLKIENNYKVLSYNELGRAYSELQDEKEGGIFSFNDIRERAILNQYPSYMKYNYLLHYDTINSDNKLNYYWGKIKYTGKGLYARTFGILESEEENFLRAQGFNEYYSKLGAGIVSGECGFGMIASSIRSVGVLKNYKCLKQGTISFMGSGELSKVGKDTVEVEKAAKALEQTKGPKDIGNAAKGVSKASEGDLKNLDTGKLEILETKTPDIANNEWLNRGYDKPPYNTEFEVKVVKAGSEKYVRVFSYNADGTSNKLGGWLMKKSDIEGLTPAQIADKYALPKPPTHICDVNVNPDFNLQTGIANKVEGWGNGGGQQFDTMGKFIDEDAFVNERLISE